MVGPEETWGKRRDAGFLLSHISLLLFFTYTQRGKKAVVVGADSLLLFKNDL